MESVQFLGEEHIKKNGGIFAYLGSREIERDKSPIC